MARLFAGNADCAFFRTSEVNVQSVTTAGRFNSAFVDSAVQVVGQDFIETPPTWYNGVTSVTTFGCRVDLYAPTNIAQRPFFELINASGRTVVQITGGPTFGTFKAQAWNGSAYIDFGNVFSTSADSLFTLAVAVNPGTTGALIVYLGGTPVAVGARPVAVDNVAKVRIRTTQNDTIWVSQLMCADYDVRDARALSQLANGTSLVNTGGTGLFTDVNEVPRNDSTSILMASVGLKRTLLKPAITVPTGLVIKSICSNMMSRVSGGTVTNQYGLLRTAGADVRSPNLLAPNNGYEPRGWSYETGANISSATYNAAEFGFESV